VFHGALPILALTRVLSDLKFSIHLDRADGSLRPPSPRFTEPEARCVDSLSPSPHTCSPDPLLCLHHRGRAARLLRRPRPLAPFLLAVAAVSHDPTSSPFVSHIHLLPFSDPIFQHASVPLPFSDPIFQLASVPRSFASERATLSYAPCLYAAAAWQQRVCAHRGQLYFCLPLRAR
jgi:hypothetical protein